MNESANMRVQRIFLGSLAVLSLLLSGCAAGPQTAYVPPTLTISTIPAGADISVQGNYVGASPVVIPMPAASLENEYRRWTEYGRADQPLLIQAQLAGYETKDVTFGDYHAPVDAVVQPLFSYSAVTKTTPGFYTFNNQITIKLSPK